MVNYLQKVTSEASIRHPLSATFCSRTSQSKCAIDGGWVFEDFYYTATTASLNKHKATPLSANCNLSRQNQCKINAGYHPKSCPCQHLSLIPITALPLLPRQPLTCDQAANPCPYPPNPSASAPRASSSHHLQQHSPISHYPASLSRFRRLRA